MLILRGFVTLASQRISRYHAGMKTSTSYRLSSEALRLLRLLAQAKGLSMASVLEVAIRELAKREGVQ
jgi:hypothetical protein